MKSFSRYIHLYLMVIALAMTQFLSAQTFRGGIAGSVQDSTGAVVANAKIVLLGTDTGYTRETVSTSAGAYSFQDLPLGNYSVTITAAGFSQKKIDGIAVRPGQVYALDISVSIATSNEQVEVNAAAVALDTVSSTNNAVVDRRSVV